MIINYVFFENLTEEIKPYIYYRHSPHSTMDSVRASEAWDAGSIPAGGT